MVGGVNGVGKSTLLREIATIDPRYEVFWGSRQLMKYLGISTDNYVSLRQLPDEYKRGKFNQLMEEVLKEHRHKTLLVDAHLFHYKRGEVVDSTGDWMGNLDGIFVVVASPEEILGRIEKDKERRDLFPEDLSQQQKLDTVEDYLQQTEEKAREISERFGIPCLVIINSEGNLDSSIRQLLEQDTRLRKEGNERKSN